MPFEPGNTLGKQFSSENQPENPGRKKNLPHLHELLEDVLGDEKDGVIAAAAILMKLRHMAISGNVRAAEILLDKYWGKAKQFIEITGKDGGPVIELIMPKGE